MLINIVGLACGRTTCYMKNFLYIFGKMDNLRFANPSHEKVIHKENSIVTKPH